MLTTCTTMSGVCRLVHSRIIRVDQRFPIFLPGRAGRKRFRFHGFNNQYRKALQAALQARNASSARQSLSWLFRSVSDGAASDSDSRQLLPGNRPVQQECKPGRPADRQRPLCLAICLCSMGRIPIEPPRRPGITTAMFCDSCPTWEALSMEFHPPDSFPQTHKYCVSIDLAIDDASVFDSLPDVA